MGHPLCRLHLRLGGSGVVRALGDPAPAAAPLAPRGAVLHQRRPLAVGAEGVRRRQRDEAGELLDLHLDVRAQGGVALRADDPDALGLLLLLVELAPNAPTAPEVAGDLQRPPT